MSIVAASVQPTCATRGRVVLVLALLLLSSCIVHRPGWSSSRPLPEGYQPRGRLATLGPADAARPGKLATIGDTAERRAVPLRIRALEVDGMPEDDRPSEAPRAADDGERGSAHPSVSPLPLRTASLSSPLTGETPRLNPSLWPDEEITSSMFRDFRAFQPMDIVTVLINEISEGEKQAETETESEFSLLAGIAELFGIETRKWAANNPSLDPSRLINATTSASFESEAETNRSGSLQARISAVIREVLPNGLLRIEGRKIVSINDEEEIIVLSGLVRPTDVNAQNQVTSDRIADMRIDFYGQGIIADEQRPGWAYRLFRRIWPF